MSLNDNLSFFYKLGEASGNSRVNSAGSTHLAETGGTVSSGAGKVGNCAVFNETNYLSVTGNPFTSDFSIGGSIRINASITSDFSAICGRWGHTNQRGYALFYDRAATRLTASVSADGTGATGASIAHSLTLSNNVWYFPQVYADLTNDLLGIRIGTESSIGTWETTSLTSASLFDSTAPFEVGRLGTSGNVFFGDIDALGGWSRRLTDEEWSTLWNAGNWMEPPFPTGFIPYFGSGHSPYQRIIKVTSY